MKINTLTQNSDGEDPTDLEPIVNLTKRLNPWSPLPVTESDRKKRTKIVEKSTEIRPSSIPDLPDFIDIPDEDYNK